MTPIHALVIAIICALPKVCAGDAFTPFEIGDGLIGCWHFAEGTGSTTADCSGGAYAGTLVSSPTWVSGSVSDYALNFDNSTNYVDISSPPTSGTITVMAWVDNDRANWSAAYSDSPNIISKLNTFNGTYVLYAFKGDEKLHFQIRLSGSESTGRDIASNSTLSSDKVHVAGSYDGTTQRLYVNCVEQTATNTISGSIDTSNNGVLRIGMHSTLVASGRGVDGNIDEVRIYDRALSSQEICGAMNERGL